MPTEQVMKSQEQTATDAPRTERPTTHVETREPGNAPLERAEPIFEVKDRLKTNAFGMSGGQQQRLCIARALAVEPDVILMDEPCSALDPISTAKIEDLMHELKQEFSIIIVTHNMQQAARV